MHHREPQAWSSGVEKSPMIVSMTSGKGGVGKTLSTVQLAMAARSLGKSVLILDGDLGLANVDILLGVRPTRSIWDVLEGRCGMRDIVVEGPLGIQVIPSGSGIFEMANLSRGDRVRMWHSLQDLDVKPDLLLIDTAAGLGEGVMDLNRLAHAVIVVTTPDPHAMTDAYAMIKVMTEVDKRKACFLVVNQSQSEAEGRKIAKRLSDVAARFLSTDVQYLGFVPHDAQLRNMVVQRRSASDLSTHTAAGQAWRRIARELFASKGLGESPTQDGCRGVLRQIVGDGAALDAGLRALEAI